NIGVGNRRRSAPSAVPLRTKVRKMSEDAQSIFAAHLRRFKRSVRLMPRVLDVYENPETKISGAVAIRILCAALDLVQSLDNTVALWQCAHQENSTSPVIKAAIQAAVPTFMSGVGAVTDKLLDAVDSELKGETTTSGLAETSVLEDVRVRLQ